MGNCQKTCGAAGRAAERGVGKGGQRKFPQTSKERFDTYAAMRNRTIHSMAGGRLLDYTAWPNITSRIKAGNSLPRAPTYRGRANGEEA
jgi:hypothetical protein